LSSRSSERLAAWTFAALIAVAFPLLLFALGRQRWFIQDEWDFLVTRRAASLDDLLRPHNTHWSTLPVLAYRALYALFGLHSYRPYQALVIALHLTAIVLLRVVMRRVGVGPWIATVSASALILFGAGQEDIVWAFQIGLVGALVLGLIQLLLADHYGPWDWRDWVGLLAGLGALMCSGVGVAMVAVVGISTFVRRGWRVAALHTVPLAAVYVVWAIAEHPGAGTNPTHRSVWYILGQVVSWEVHGIPGTFHALGYYAVGGVILAVTLVVGFYLGIRARGVLGFAYAVAPVLALLVGFVALIAVTAWGRWEFGPDYASSSRYVYLSAALLLPSLALAIDCLNRRWAVVGPLALAVLVIGVPGNIASFRDGTYVGPRFDHQRQMVLSVAFSPLAGRVPAGLRPDPRSNSELTIGWLVDARADGKLPEPGRVPKDVLDQVPVRLGFRQALFRVAPRGCRPVTEPLVLTPAPGQQLVLSGGLVRVSNRSATGWSVPVVYDTSNQHLFVVDLPGLHLRIAPGSNPARLRVCR
jgi:hypothetical protein